MNSIPLLFLSALLSLLAIVLYRLPLEPWVTISSDSEVKQTARAITIGVVILLAAVSLFGAITGE